MRVWTVIEKTWHQAVSLEALREEEGSMEGSMDGRAWTEEELVYHRAVFAQWRELKEVPAETIEELAAEVNDFIADEFERAMEEAIRQNEAMARTWEHVEEGD
ncbi:MAG: hypothetical protein ACRD1P_07345 [Thermoanaerobaculia bacterium]